MQNTKDSLQQDYVDKMPDKLKYAMEMDNLINKMNSTEDFDESCKYFNQITELCQQLSTKV